MSDIRKWIDIIENHSGADEYNDVPTISSDYGVSKYVSLIESAYRVDESFKDAEAKFTDEADDSENVNEYLEKFKELAKRNVIKGPEKDISRWIKAGWNEFKEYVDKASTVKTKRQQKRKVKSDSILVHEDDEKMVVIPLSEKASCFYGKNTQWCTAAEESDNQFEEYFGRLEVTLFYVLFKNGDKYAAATTGPGGYEFFDNQDRSMNKESFEADTDVTTDMIDAWHKENQPLIEKAREKYSPEGKAEYYLEQFKNGEISNDKLTQELNEIIDDLDMDNEVDFTIHHVDKEGNIFVDIEEMVDKTENGLKYINGDEMIEFFGATADYENSFNELTREWKNHLIQYLLDNYREEIEEELDLDEDKELTALDVENNIERILENDVADEIKMAFDHAEEDAMRSYAESQIVDSIRDYITDNATELNLSIPKHLFDILHSKEQVLPIANNDVKGFLKALKSFELEEYEQPDNLDGVDYDYLPEIIRDRLGEEIGRPEDDKED